MTDPQSPHISEEQFAEYVGGGRDLSAEIRSHLQGCAACREEIEAFHASVQSFNDLSLAWSASRPAESLHRRVRTARAQPRWAVVSWALAGCLVAASAVSVGTRYGEQREAAETRVPASSELTDAQIERDNNFLMAVDQATSLRPASPLQEYGIGVSPAGRGKGHTSRTAND